MPSGILAINVQKEERTSVEADMQSINIYPKTYSNVDQMGCRQIGVFVSGKASSPLNNLGHLRNSLNCSGGRLNPHLVELLMHCMFNVMNSPFQDLLWKTHYAAFW